MVEGHLFLQLFAKGIWCVSNCSNPQIARVNNSRSLISCNSLWLGKRLNKRVNTQELMVPHQEVKSGIRKINQAEEMTGLSGVLKEFSVKVSWCINQEERSEPCKNSGRMMFRQRTRGKAEREEESEEASESGHTKWCGKGVRMLPLQELMETISASDFLLYVVHGQISI